MSRRPKTSGVSVKVSTLSDDELIGMLEERGVEVGPIGDTTRNVYQKKLQKLLDSDVRPVKVPSKPAPSRPSPIRPATSRQSPPRRSYKKQELNDDDDDDYVNESHHDDDDDVEPDDEVENDDDDDRYGIRRFSPFSSGKADSYRDDIRDVPTAQEQKSARSHEMHVRHSYRNDSPRTQQVEAPTSSLYNRERNWRSDHGEESSAYRTEYSRSYETRYTSGDLSRSPLARPSLQGQDVRRSPDKKPRSWCPLWVQFLILLIFSAAVFIFVQYVGWSPANLKMLGQTVEPKENGKASQ